MLLLLPTAILGYLLGSFPTAYLLVHWKSNIDIRKAGSGNVGTLNSLQVTGSNVIGIAVLLADVLKGVIAVLLGKAIGGDEFWPGALCGLCAVAGHNFPVWLKFRGGRGLATAVGVASAFAWMFIAPWLVLWAIGFSIWKKVNMGNAFASLMLAVASLALPDKVIGFLVPVTIPLASFRLFVVVLMALVLVKHIEPVQKYFKEKQLQNSQA